MMTSEIALVQIKHLVLTQYYRWYQVYEVPFTPQTIANQKDILTTNVEITSQQGVAIGKEGLEERLKVFDGWKNAHHVQNTLVRELEDGNWGLDADIVYQNIRPDGSSYSYIIHYAIIMEPRNGDLPLLFKVKLQPVNVIHEFVFKDAYCTNRAHSFVNYWLYLLSSSDENRLKELLDDEWVICYYQEDVFTDVKSFITKLAHENKIFVASCYEYDNLQISKVSKDAFCVQLDLKRIGILQDNSQEALFCRQELTFSNNIKDRFAKLRKLKWDLK